MVLRKSFYIRWSAGRSPRVHEVKSGSGSFTTREHDTNYGAPFPARPIWADPNRVRDATKTHSITQNHIFAEAITKLGKPINI